MFGAPQWFVVSGLKTASERATAQNDIRNTWLKLSAGVAATFAAVVTLGRLELSKSEHEIAKNQERLALRQYSTDLSSKAVEQLGHDKPSVRMGGLYSIAELAQAEDRRVTGYEVICAFVRDQADSRRTMSTLSPDPKLAVDLLTAIRLLGNRPTGTPADLTFSYFAFADLSSTRLAGTNLTGADLTGANLNQVDLHGARLEAGRFAGANLAIADLTGADLADADFAGANLIGAKLIDTRLFLTEFTGANLTGADLTGANVASDFTRADLTGANLVDVDLTAAAHLAKAELRGAKYRESTRWPNGFEIAASGAEFSRRPPDTAATGGRPPPAAPTPPVVP